MDHPLASIRSASRGFLEEGIVATQGDRGARSARHDQGRRQDFNVIDGARRKGDGDAKVQYATAITGRVWKSQTHMHGKHESFQVSTRNARSG